MEETDLGCVLEEVIDAQAEWYNVGLKLQVRPGTLDGIKLQYHNPKDALREMLKEWLKMANPRPTWKALVNALGSRAVGKVKMATELEHKYCPTLSVAGKLYCRNLILSYYIDIKLTTAFKVAV